MQTHNIPSNGESQSDHASEQSINQSVTCLEQRVFVKEQQQNNKLLEKLKDFLKFERQTVQTEINQLRNPNPFKKAVGDISGATTLRTDIDLAKNNEQLRQRVNQLQAEVETLHILYNKRLEEESSKANEKNEFFLHLIDQLHNKHAEEVDYYRSVISEFEQERKHITNIEVKMSQIGTGIQDILKESSELTRRNEQLEGRLLHEQKELGECHKQLNRYRQLTANYQVKADQYEKLRLRGIKYQKDLTELIDDADHRLGEIPTHDRTVELCKVTGAAVGACPHCRLNNMEGKYSKLLGSDNP